MWGHVAMKMRNIYMVIVKVIQKSHYKVSNKTINRRHRSHSPYDNIYFNDFCWYLDGRWWRHTRRYKWRAPRGIYLLFDLFYLHFIYRWQYIKTHDLKVQLNCSYGSKTKKCFSFHLKSSFCCRNIQIFVFFLFLSTCSRFKRTHSCLWLEMALFI